MLYWSEWKYHSSQYNGSCITPNNYFSYLFLPFLVLNSDAAAQYVDSNGQDMIVVIQSDDFDQSQGLIVVDPSQLQQMVSSGSAQVLKIKHYN